MNPLMSYCIFVMAFIGNTILISVGFDIVCPRWNGNAKAKTSGMGKSQNPALFLCLLKRLKRNEENTIHTMSLGMSVCKTVFVLCTIIRSSHEQT